MEPMSPRAVLWADALFEAALGAFLLLVATGVASMESPLADIATALLGAALLGAAMALYFAGADARGARILPPLAAVNAAGTVIIVVWLPVASDDFTPGSTALAIATAVALALLAAAEAIVSRRPSPR